MAQTITADARVEKEGLDSFMKTFLPAAHLREAGELVERFGSGEDRLFAAAFLAQADKRGKFAQATTGLEEIWKELCADQPNDGRARLNDRRLCQLISEIGLDQPFGMSEPA